ncbi:hypothetical protein [Marininema halotolerans]|nr:hypothetical protein [Marininema halotolerans]
MSKQHLVTKESGFGMRLLKRGSATTIVSSLSPPSTVRYNGAGT